MTKKTLWCLFLCVGTTETCSAAAEQNIDYYGNDVGDIQNLPSVESCCEACSQRADCSFYTFRPSDGNCWLKSSDSGRRQASDRISGRAGGSTGKESRCTRLGAGICFLSFRGLRPYYRIVQFSFRRTDDVYGRNRVNRTSSPCRLLFGLRFRCSVSVRAECLQSFSGLIYLATTLSNTTISLPRPRAQTDAKRTPSAGTDDDCPLCWCQTFVVSVASQGVHVG